MSYMTKQQSYALRQKQCDGYSLTEYPFNTIFEGIWQRYGKLFILVPPHYTSRICHQCGWDSGKKPLDIREWACPHCHETHDRDINAAINILYRGLETYLQSQLLLLNEQAKNGYFSTVFFQVASQWLKQTISYFNQALEIA